MDVWRFRRQIYDDILWRGGLPTALLHVLGRIKNSLVTYKQRVDKVCSQYSVEQIKPLMQKMFNERLGYQFDFEAPVTFNEKIQWIKLYDSTPEKTLLADKLLVREWVNRRVGNQILVPLLGFWNNFDDIDFDSLPDSFVLKANHGSSMNIFVCDKRAFDKAGGRKKFKEWMAVNFAFENGFEMHYRDIPRKIIAEKYIADMDGDIFDYRFFCFNGEPKFVWLDIGSGTSHHRRNIYDMEWNKKDYLVSYDNIEGNPEKPQRFSEMVLIVKELCKFFSFVRVDLYFVGGVIYFGEMTFTPQSGLDNWKNEKIDKMYGDFLKLPTKYTLSPRK